MNLCFLLSCLSLAGCAAAVPAMVTIDGEPFASIQPDGWHHVSGELALPTQRERVGVLPNGLFADIGEAVVCEDDTCRFVVAGSGFEVRGSEVWRAGVHRGDIANASRTERLHVVALLSTYEPPGPVTVGITARLPHGLADFQVSAMPSGDLVRDLSCKWPERCTGPENVVGTWSEEAVTVNGITIVLSDALAPKDGGWRYESQHPGRAVELNATGQIRGPSDSVWRATERFGGSLVPAKRQVETSSPAAAAAFTGAVLELEAWWLSARAIAPSPPPPPPM